MKQKLLQTDSAIKIFNHATSPTSVAPDNLGVRVQRKHTLYVVMTGLRTTVSNSCTWSINMYQKQLFRLYRKENCMSGLEMKGVFFSTI